MVISKETLEKIKKIIENNYNHLVITLLGQESLSEEELRELERAGFDISNQDSLLELLYYNHVLNEIGDNTTPINVPEMKQQQKARPIGDAHTSATEHINETLQHYIDRMKEEAKSGFEAVIRDTNFIYRNNALQNLDRPEALDDLVKQSTLGELKQKLRDFTGDSNRNWARVAVTETSNTIGMGSVDRIVSQNTDKEPKEVYVYRISVRDQKLCTACRKFYVDSDGSPAVYRLSTILANGTNYGKKQPDWKPVIGATHPNCFVGKHHLIFTEKGWVRVCDVKTGDLVLTHKKRFRKVTQFLEFPYPKKKAIRINYHYKNKLRSLTITPEHKVFTNRGWVEAQHLLKNDKILKLQKKCEVCDNFFDIELVVRRGNRICSTDCKSQLSKKIVKSYHDNLSEIDKIKRAANCSYGTKEAYKQGKIVSPFAKEGYWTEERRREASESVFERQLLKKAASTRVSKKQKLAYGWLVSNFNEEIITLEYCVDKYSIDIAFPKHKIGIEIDGIHHDEKRREIDKKRDAVLESKGWTILRFGYKLPQDVTKSNIINTVSNVLKNHNKEYSFTEIDIDTIRVVYTDYRTKLYSISVEEDESLVSHGIISHNCRESGILELRPGWKVLPDGGVEFIGKDAWEKYIKSKVRS